MWATPLKHFLTADIGHMWHFLGLIAAVAGLRAELRQRGSDLVLLYGPVEVELPALAAALGATTVLAEDEVEYR